MVVRQYNEELKYLEKINPHCWRIKKGFQPNMNVEGVFYVNSTLEKLMLDELRNSCRPGMTGGFLPGVKQIANVAALPGIVGKSVGLPDIHSGYGFAIGEERSLFYTVYIKLCLPCFSHMIPCEFLKSFLIFCLHYDRNLFKISAFELQGFGTYDVE